MKNLKLFIGAAIILPAFAFTVIQTVYWKVKEDYSVKIPAQGISFKGLKASILFDEKHPEKSIITATIDATTVQGGNANITREAKEQLASAKFPSISFVSLAVTKTSNGYESTGNLTLKGVTKQIKLPFKFDSQKNSDMFPIVFKETFQGTITIAPSDFNITKYKPGEMLTIELTIPVTK